MKRASGIITILMFFLMVLTAVIANNYGFSGGIVSVTPTPMAVNSFPTTSPVPTPSPTPSPSPSPTIPPSPSLSPSPSPSPVAINGEVDENEDFTQPEDPLLVLVNKDVKLPEDYSFQPRLYSDVTVSDIIYSNMAQMLEDARSRGLGLWVASAYRSVEEQERLLQEGIESRMKDYDMDYDEALENALNSFSKPGYSEHHTGLAIDFNYVTADFEYTDEYKWLQENAWRYGFVQRYPKDKVEITGIIHEPWHYRYVGVDHAKIMTEENLCLEEYIDKLLNE